MPGDERSTGSSFRRRAAGAWVAALCLALSGCASIGSVGAVIAQDQDSGKLVVRDAPKGMGAANAGIRPGDEILMIDGHDVRGMSPEDVSNALRGEIGTKVTLTILRKEGTVERVAVVRGPFRSPR